LETFAALREVALDVEPLLRPPPPSPASHPKTFDAAAFFPPPLSLRPLPRGLRTASQKVEGLESSVTPVGPTSCTSASDPSLVADARPDI